MIFTNIAGAMAIVEHDGKRMLFDPWLDDGIFHGSWYHYPPPTIGPADLGRFDYVYISHIHEDHCSAATLRAINADAEVVLMDRHPNLVAKFLADHHLGFAHVTNVKPRTPVQIADGLIVDMVEPDPTNAMSAFIDSMLVLSWGGFVVVNANDCQLWEGALEYLETTYPNIDLALLPHSGGSGYPACYSNLAAEEKDREVRRIRDGRAQAFVDVVDRLGPRMALPFADQYVVGGTRSTLNRWVAHPPGPGYLRGPMTGRGLADRLLLLNPGQAVDLATAAVLPDEPFVEHTESDREAYVAGLPPLPYDHERFDMSPSVSVERLLRYARDRLWAQQQQMDLFPEWDIYLEVPEQRRCFRVRLTVREIEAVPIAAPRGGSHLVVSAPASLLVLLLVGHVSWNIADAALFLDYERQPNVYEPSVYILLNLLKA